MVLRDHVFLGKERVRFDRVLVGEEGIEPSWCCHPGILSPLRIPFRHSPASENGSTDQAYLQPFRRFFNADFFFEVTFSVA